MFARDGHPRILRLHSRSFQSFAFVILGASTRRTSLRYHDLWLKTQGFAAASPACRHHASFAWSHLYPPEQYISTQSSTMSTISLNVDKRNKATCERGFAESSSSVSCSKPSISNCSCFSARLSQNLMHLHNNPSLLYHILGGEMYSWIESLRLCG